MHRSLLLAAFLLSGLSALPVWAQSVKGLVGTYYRGMNFEKKVLTRTDAAIDFDWDYGRPAPQLPQQFYSVRWTGYVTAPQTGVYSLVTTTDDGMRVWIDDQLVLDQWRPQRPTSYAVKVALKAGQSYALRVEYYQAQFEARARLLWQLPNSQKLTNLAAALTTEAPLPRVPVTPPPAPSFAQPRPLRAEVRALAESRPSPPPAARPKITPAKPRPVVKATPPPKPAPARPPTVKPKPKPTPPPVAQRPVPRPLAAAAPRPAVKARPKPTPRPVAAIKPAPTPKPEAAPTLVATAADLGTLARGTTVEIPQLHFFRGKAELVPAAEPVLQQLLKTLRDNPELRLEIAGHTDNQGDAAQNQRLSEDRARSICQYLIRYGIGPDRLTATGYGGTRPIADNTDPAQRARNRRVEVTVQ